jgi:hypothetical protein
MSKKIEFIILKLILLISFDGGTDKLLDMEG